MQEPVRLACLHVAWGPEEPDLKKTGTEPASRSHEEEMPEWREKATGIQTGDVDKGPNLCPLCSPPGDL